MKLFILSGFVTFLCRFMNSSFPKSTLHPIGTWLAVLRMWAWARHVTWFVSGWAIQTLANRCNFSRCQKQKQVLSFCTPNEVFGDQISLLIKETLGCLALYLLVQEGEMRVHWTANLPVYFISHFHTLSYLQTSPSCLQWGDWLPPPSLPESVISESEPVFHSVLSHMSIAFYPFSVFQNLVRISVPSPHYFLC